MGRGGGGEDVAFIGGGWVDGSKLKVPRSQEGVTQFASLIRGIQRQLRGGEGFALLSWEQSGSYILKGLVP